MEDLISEHRAAKDNKSKSEEQLENESKFIAYLLA